MHIITLNDLLHAISCGDPVPNSVEIREIPGYLGLRGVHFAEERTATPAV
jgi:hypothetical protein